MAGSDDNAARRAAAPAPHRSYASLAAAICAGEPAALRQAYMSFMPLLRYHARRTGRSVTECEELAATVLGDVLLYLQETKAPPVDLVRYLISALRNEVRSEHRDRERVVATEQAAYTAPHLGRERIVAECHSEYAMRASAMDGGADDAPLRSAIRALAERSAAQLSDGDLALLVGLSHHVPMRELADEGGISYANARQRITRLRQRFRTLVLQHLSTLHGRERREIERFIRRAGIELNATLSRDITMQAVPRRDDATEEGSDDSK